MLQIGSELDIGGGRMIPKISTHQYAATLARWVGVSDADMNAIAPNLQNFTPRYLDFLPPA